MNQLKIFENAEFGQMRTLQLNSETYFIGTDVASALGYVDGYGALKKHVDEEDKLVCQIDSAGQKRDATVINESGLYALIFGSKLESAKRFKHWVTSEVLPSIRKTGSYQKPMSAVEQLQLTQQAVLEVKSQIDAVDDDLQAFKQDMPILGIEESKITTAVRRVGVKCLGGKASDAYRDKSLRGKVYSDIYGQLKRQFGVATYKAIKRSQCEEAIQVIEKYDLPLILFERVRSYNAQYAFE